MRARGGGRLTDALVGVVVQAELQAHEAPELLFGPQADGIIKKVTPVALRHVPLPTGQRFQVRPKLLRLFANPAPRTHLHPPEARNRLRATMHVIGKVLRRLRLF